jgi:hypothetical protein
MLRGGYGCHLYCYKLSHALNIIRVCATRFIGGSEMFTWDFLERYHDVIVSVLDLASFLLVTPVFFRYLDSDFLAKILYFALLGIVVTFFRDPLERLTAGWQIDSGIEFSLTIAFLVLIAGAPLVALYLLSDWLLRHVAAFGVAVYAISRCLALMYAIHQLP